MQIAGQLLRERGISKHYQTFKMQCFVKRIMSECRHKTRRFSGQERFCGTKAFQ